MGAAGEAEKIVTQSIERRNYAKICSSLLHREGMIVSAVLSILVLGFALGSVRLLWSSSASSTAARGAVAGPSSTLTSPATLQPAIETAALLAAAAPGTALEGHDDFAVPKAARAAISVLAPAVLGTSHARAG